MSLITGLGFQYLQGPMQLNTNGNICGPIPASLPSYVYAFWVPPILVEISTFGFVVYKSMERRRNSIPKDWLTARVTLKQVTFKRLTLRFFGPQLPAYELFIPLTFALPSVIGARLLLNFRELLTQDRHEYVVSEIIALKAINQPDQAFILRNGNMERV
ncbi:hypothetical protein M422DRAFT_56901 [Sphaerobolus stellatus SS14]|uniref:Uncharacterized protein n=1 Tax=Sphaerobolus stellatus (strain SS14) TaxID=990650 RepID=A0A0C9U2I1_SPHS4|nr:hypothetical protein M422DRAFT_56901 [Sphaerobolus stellatus SS14]